MPRGYLDSCAVIYYVERHPSLGARVEAMLLAPALPRLRLVYSDSTRLECRVVPLRNDDPGLLARYDRVFDLPDCERAELNRAAFDLATELRARHGLRMPDAFHLAAAVAGKCDESWTNDRRLAAAAQDRVALTIIDQQP